MALAVKATTGVGPVLLVFPGSMARVASSPSSTGMCTSISTRS